MCMHTTSNPACANNRCVTIPCFLIVTDGNGSNGYHYTFAFNASGLPRQAQPTNIQLHLRMVTSDQPAVIKVNTSQQEFIWQQSELYDKDAKTTEDLSVRISLRSQLTNSSSSRWTNDMLIVEVASTNPIKIPSKKHHQTAVGLLLYMGGVPEVIDELLAKPVDKSAHLITDKKERFKIGEGKRNVNTPCQLKDGFRVTFSQVGGGYQYIIQPKSLDIGQCVGECPHYLHHLHNPSEHAEVRNLLAFREGSASADVTTASCVATSFKPQPIVLYNKASSMITYETYDKLVATSCGCR